MQTTLRKRILQILLLLSLTAFACWFALKDDCEEVLYNISHISWYWIVVLIGLGTLYYLLQGIVLYRIARPYKADIRIRDGIHNAYIAAFFNGVTPLGGGQVAQTYAFRKLHLQYSDIASILWKDFFLYQSTVLVYVSVLLLLRFTYAIKHFQFYFFLVLLGFAINASVILILWTMARFPRLYVKISRGIVTIGYRFHIVKNKAYTLEKWQGQILYFNEEIKKLKQDGRMIVEAVLLNFLRMTIFYAIPYIAAIALQVPLALSDLINVLLMSACIHMLNALTPLPGDTGWTESAFILIFAVLFGRTDASSVMILWRVATYHIQILIGGSIFLYVKSAERFPSDKETSPAEENIKTQTYSYKKR